MPWVLSGEEFGSGSRAQPLLHRGPVDWAFSESIPELPQQLGVPFGEIVVRVIPFFALFPARLRQCHARGVALCLELEQRFGALAAYRRELLGRHSPHLHAAARREPDDGSTASLAAWIVNGPFAAIAQI